MNNMVHILATIPPEISGALTDMSDLWDDIKPFVLAVGVFVILWRFFKRRAKA